MKKAKRSPDAVLPTPGELRLLRILWRIGEGSIDDILEAADESPAPNYKTVQTLLRIMERKGQVDHSQKGRCEGWRVHREFPHEKFGHAMFEMIKSGEPIPVSPH